MNRITITISIDVPEGASVSMGGDPLHHDELASLPVVAQTNGSVVAANPDAPLCGIHHKPMRSGRYGFFCTQKAEQGQPADAKGYCAWKVK